MSATLQLMGAWEKDHLSTTLQNALAVSVDVMGRTGEEACRHAIILMAQSARAMARTAPARRPVEANPRFKHLLSKEQYKALRNSKVPKHPYFKLHAWKLTQGSPGQRELFANDRNAIAKIGNRGLAKRSWMWGLSAFGASEGARGPIPGTSELFGVKSGDMAGYVKQNKLGYIAAAMPAGWEQAVQTKAGNKIMGQARDKMQRAWQGAVGRNQKAAVRTLNDHFKAV